MLQPDLIKLFAVPLERAGMEYVITGSVASILYAEPRLTHDIDIIVRKMQYFKEGGSDKHLRDIQGMVAILKDGLDRTFIEAQALRLGLKDVWRRVQEV
jgi:hypothetical protein